MNHWTIGKKLYAAFLAVTAITLLTGLLGYYSQVKNNKAIGKLGNICLPSVQSLLTIKENAGIMKSAQRTLLSPDLDMADRKRQPHTIAKAAAAAAAAWKVFEPLPQIAGEAAIWKDFVSDWEQAQKDNVEFFKINDELESLDILNPMALERDLQQFVGDHYKLMLKTLDRVQTGAELTGGEDPTACHYGLWLAKFETTNPELKRIIEATRASHSAFHASVKAAKELAAKGDKEGALKIIHGDMEKAEAKTFEGFDAMLAEAAKATALREKLNHQLMNACYVSLNKALGQLDKLIDINKADGAATTKASMSQGSTLRFLNFVGMLASTLTALGLGLFITRSLVKTLSQTAKSLSEGSDQVASASGEIASASQSLAEGASEQAASLEETSASLEEIASMTKRNAENALTAKDLSSDTRQAAETGSVAMEEMNRAMADIQSASSNISKIIKTIDEIAFQTNILALNAAVEAAHAGESGAGFAVVANEVRNLAQRSAQAAKETAEKIEDSIIKSANGVAISSKVTESLTRIVTKARQVDELVAEIADASREQSQGIEQVNTAVTQMDKVTQTNAATAEESASASEQLNAQASTLRELVADLQNLVGGSAGAGQPNTPREVLHTRPHRPQRNGSSAQSAAPSRPALGSCRPALSSSKRKDPESEIPMEGDFRDF